MAREPVKKHHWGPGAAEVRAREAHAVVIHLMPARLEIRVRMTLHRLSVGSCEFTDTDPLTRDRHGPFRIVCCTVRVDKRRGLFWSRQDAWQDVDSL
jgi:hypothetical protein